MCIRDSAKLVGTTKPTIAAIRDRTHWNIQNIEPIDPVALGLCRQSELDSEIQKAAEKRAREGGVMSDDERRKLVSTSQSLVMNPTPRISDEVEGLDIFAAETSADEEDAFANFDDSKDADSFFNLPAGGGDEEDEE